MSEAVLDAGPAASRGCCFLDAQLCAPAHPLRCGDCSEVGALTVVLLAAAMTHQLEVRPILSSAFGTTLTRSQHHFAARAYVFELDVSHRCNIKVLAVKWTVTWP